MVRNSIMFIGEDNKINSELYQILNWRFQIMQYTQAGDVTLEEINVHEPRTIVISLVGNKFDFCRLFECLKKDCPDIPVITIGSESESRLYNSYYESEQFHSILRPATARRVLEVCRAVIAGKIYEEEAANEAEAARDKAHILVVDDNAMLLRTVKKILEEKYSVAVAAAGVQAFVSIGKKKPDLILLDYEMPQMNGKEVLEKLQSDEELNEIPVVFLTSADSKEIVMELLALKPAGYILKPVDTEMLFQKIEGIIGK